MKRLICAECGCSADEGAEGWQGHLAGIREEGEAVEVSVFCPRCAAREFGRDSEGREGAGSAYPR